MKEAIDFLVKKEAIFAHIIERYGLPIIPRRPQGLETLVLLILEQQVSIDAAKATFLRLKSIVSIEPELLLTLSDEDYRNQGISRQKTSYIKGLSLALINNEIDLNGLKDKSTQEVREALIKIKGIGNWTIDIYLMFSLEHPDILPIGDIAVITTLKELFDFHKKEDIASYVVRWSPYRSYATFLLWHYYLTKRNRKVTY